VVQASRLHEWPTLHAALQWCRLLRDTRRVTRVVIKAGLFEGIEDPGRLHLIGGLCSECARRHFPPQETCPYCGADGCQPTNLSRYGTLHLYTTVTSRPPGYDGPVPYGFGVVELSDGIRVISRIVGGENAPLGIPVEITLETVGRDPEGRELVTYAFRPRATSPERRATP
jgi:uncharacterized OB-fold protein